MISFILMQFHNLFTLITSGFLPHIHFHIISMKVEKSWRQRFLLLGKPPEALINFVTIYDSRRSFQSHGRTIGGAQFYMFCDNRQQFQHQMDMYEMLRVPLPSGNNGKTILIRGYSSQDFLASVSDVSRHLSCSKHLLDNQLAGFFLKCKQLNLLFYLT